MCSFFQEFRGSGEYINNSQAPVQDAIDCLTRIQILTNIFPQKVNPSKYYCLFHLSKACSPFQTSLKSPLLHETFINKTQKAVGIPLL